MRNEYPRPELERNNFINLNGEWDFEFDFHNTLHQFHPLTAGAGVQKWSTWEIQKNFTKKINVPFCPESKLSGIEYTDFIIACWYRKKVDILKKSDKRYILNFEAVFHTAHVFANDKLVAVHKGGYTPFSVDITDCIQNDSVEIKVHCYGDTRRGDHPSGKQSPKQKSYGCFYTRTTGIWQTVWIEEVEQNYLERIKIDADADNSCVHIQLFTNGKDNKRITATAFFAGEKCGQSSVVLKEINNAYLTIELNRVELWEIDNPQLYDLVIETESNGKVDTVNSYFAIRKISLDSKGLKINGKRVFQRLVLDQGYYPDGIYTAPSDQDLIKDIILSKELGFNGARLHEKVFERRFLYHADKLGYLVWGEYPNWGFDHTRPENYLAFLPEWLESMQRDYNHPCIIGWCPFNENFPYLNGNQCDELVEQVYLESKRMDCTRPVIDVSWNFHVKTDIYDVHDYTFDDEEFKKKFECFEPGKVFDSKEQKYNGEPYFLSEFGGFKWPTNTAGWAYGEVKSEEEFAEKLERFVKILYKNPRICAFCYTQLYDVEQEKNGLYYYDRSDKFNREIKQKINKALLNIAEYEKL